MAILEYIGEHAGDPELCVNQIADHFGMHRTMITRLLKNHFGLSFTDYLLKLRIGKAQQMLRETDKSLSEIAELTGYGRLPYLQARLHPLYGHAAQGFPQRADRERRIGIYGGLTETRLKGRGECGRIGTYSAQ